MNGHFVSVVIVRSLGCGKRLGALIGLNKTIGPPRAADDKREGCRDAGWDASRSRSDCCWGSCLVPARRMTTREVVPERAARPAKAEPCRAEPQARAAVRRAERLAKAA